MKRLAVGSTVIALTVIAALSAAGSAAVAEVFILSGGGRLAGELLNKDESPREKFIIKTGGGVRVTLRASQVKQMLHTQPEELEYEAIRRRFPDTVAGQWALAEWCRERRLATGLRLRRLALTPAVEEGVGFGGP